MSLSGSKSAKQMAFAERLRLVRHDLYGDAGGRQALADTLGIPIETWMNYESGVVMPAEVVLKLQVVDLG